MKVDIGKILLIDDNSFEFDFMQRALIRINVQSELVCFNKAEEALRYLIGNNDKIFLIFSDVSMPMMNGFEFKNAIDADHHLRKKSIPFIFLTSSATPKDVNLAFEKSL
jgi:CheY-like chemotaxis protein